MRLNLPITDQQYTFPHGYSLVSTTDSKGRILYCNKHFIEVSGFEKAELQGQPHNILRHPDMPEEAYRDMWLTIKAGRPWSGPIKNRRKDGSYYWVMANVTPLIENDKIFGYMSVRTTLSDQQIEDAEQLYSTMREEKKAGRLIHTFNRGHLQKRTLIGRLNTLMRFNLITKLMLVMLFLLLASSALHLLLPAAESANSRILAWGVQVALFASTGWFLSQLLIRPLASLADTASQLASGNLTETLTRTRNDELGELQMIFGQISINLKSIVGDVREQSLAMVRDTNEISQGNQQLSERTAAQASNLAQTASSMEEITGTVKLTADSAQEASRLSEKASEIAESGDQAVNEVGATMMSIQESAQGISDIIGVIDSIAFQTNILALNAAVEAARVGEQGRGFAVVASEVQALAQRSTQAAQEVKQLIEASVQAVDIGQQRTEIARKTMSEVVARAQSATGLVQEISNATREQLIGISQINEAMAQLNNITQQNMLLVGQVTSSVDSLKETTRNTTETVQVLRIDKNTNRMLEADARRREAKAQRRALAAANS